MMKIPGLDMMVVVIGLLLLLNCVSMVADAFLLPSSSSASSSACAARSSVHRLSLPALPALRLGFAPLNSNSRPRRRFSSSFLAFAAAGSDSSGSATSGLPPKNPPPPAGYKPKIYAYYRSRSKIIEFYLQELGIPYFKEEIAMDKQEHKAPDFIKNVNPYGKLPVITLANGEPLIESGAQLLYLADVFDPYVNTAEERAIASQYTHFANASLGPAIFMKEQRESGVMDKLFSVLDQELAARPYLQGDRFSVSDVAVGSYLSYIPVFFPDIKLDAYPNLQAYVGRITSRPAFKATVGAPPPSTA